MASSFPILFGAPSFGDEDRDQWIRVLQLFLADPFQPHAVNVGGTTQVKYGWDIPAGAITGGINAAPLNSYGIPQMLVSSTLTDFDNAAIVSLADRPGFLLLWVFYQSNDNIGVLAGLGPSSQLWFTGSSTSSAGDLSPTKDDAGKISLYQESNVYYLQNNTGLDLKFTALFIGTGPLFSSGEYV